MLQLPSKALLCLLRGRIFVMQHAKSRLFSLKWQGSAHGGRRWAVPPTSQWLPPFTDLPQSSLMHAWKTYLTNNLPNCHLLRHDLYPIIIKMIIIFTWGNIFLISYMYVRSLYRWRVCHAGSRHLQWNLIESDRNSGDSLSGYFILSRDNPICPYKLSKQLQFVKQRKGQVPPAHLSKNPGQNPEMGFWVIVLFNKRVSLAFISYIAHVSRPYQSKAMRISKCYCVNLCKITLLRKRQLKVEILHNLKELWKDFLNLIWFSK